MVDGFRSQVVVGGHGGWISVTLFFGHISMFRISHHDEPVLRSLYYLELSSGSLFLLLAS